MRPPQGPVSTDTAVGHLAVSSRPMLLLPKPPQQSLSECLSSGGYAGSQFVVRVVVADGGKISEVTTVGADFLKASEMGCLRRKIHGWDVRDVKPDEYLLRVVL
jgi:hypothetical protein